MKSSTDTGRGDVAISISVIAADLSTFGSVLPGLGKDTVDYLHIDVMDGSFVPNLTIGPGYIASLARHTDIPLDVHLMIEAPERSIDQYIGTTPWGIGIHYESTRFPARVLTRIREAGIRAGLTINPATPVTAVFDLLPWCDHVLVMSVDPGFYGQAFMEPAIPRIRALRDEIDRNHGGRILLQADGGITRENIARVAAAGADCLITGSSAFAGGQVADNVSALKQAARG